MVCEARHVASKFKIPATMKIMEILRLHHNGRVLEVFPSCRENFRACQISQKLHKYFITLLSDFNDLRRNKNIKLNCLSSHLDQLPGNPDDVSNVEGKRFHHYIKASSSEEGGIFTGWLISARVLKETVSM